jgi:hypothetical protein
MNQRSSFIILLFAGDGWVLQRDSRVEYDSEEKAIKAAKEVTGKTMVLDVNQIGDVFEAFLQRQLRPGRD